MDLLSLAEITLILVLFTDVARIDLNRNRKDHDLPVRMLLIGLPLTIVAGTFFAAWLFPDFSIWQAALLAALLAPTDAALSGSGSGWEDDKVMNIGLLDRAAGCLYRQYKSVDIMPPSTTRLWPVMKREAAVHRNKHASATSLA